jgi:hypothetical protein
MHIHGLSGINAANFSGAAANGRAEANRRAADTRRKLAVSADTLSDDETFLVGHWLDSRAQDSPPGGEYGGSSDSGRKDLA